MMILIMIDECGDEYEVDRYNVDGLDVDADYFEIWKDMKIEQASEEYPEANGFYFEDRRGWNMRISAMIHSGFQKGEN